MSAAEDAALAPGVDTPEQEALRDSVRSLLAKRAGSEEMRAATRTTNGYDESLWSALAEQIGAAALGIPEAYDGAGASYLETHLVADELGRSLAPSPLLGSAVLAGYALLASGDEAACAEHLPNVASGAIYAVCWSGTMGWHDPGVAFDGTTLSGTVQYVLGGDYASTLIVVAADAEGSPTLHVCPADAGGVDITREPVMDPTRTMATVRFDGVHATRLATGPETLNLLNAVAWAAVSAEAVGAAKALVERTVEYTSQRKQFGREIGGFQALKHRMADMYVRSETARSLSYSAAAAVARAFEVAGSGPAPDAARAAAYDAEVEAAAAKVYATRALSWIAGEAIQLHGGVGITWEYDVQLFFKRAHGLATLFGQPHELAEALEPAAGLPRQHS